MYEMKMNKDMALIYDTIVIGAGIEGSATAYHLAKTNKTTLLLEQFLLPHTRGSSHGQSRIIRKAYVQQHYASMMKEAYAMWRDLEQETVTKVFYKTGLLVVGGPSSDDVDKSEKALAALGAVYQKLTGVQINQQFPMLRFNPNDTGLFDNEAGVLLADKSIQGFQKMFIHYGGELRDGEPVFNILPGKLVTVTTPKATYQARSVVLTAGPWTNNLTKPLGLDLPLQPQKVTVCYWRLDDQRYRADRGFPTFIGDLSTVCYALPALEYPNHIKICVHEGPEIDPESRDTVSTDEHINELKRLVSRHFAGVDTEPSIMESCIYTWTPDEDFILDQHPHYDNIIIGAGFSGHGFKMAPVIGKILSRLASKEILFQDLTPFCISRFKTSNKAKL